MHIIKLCTLYVCLNNFKKEDGHRPDGRALLEYRSIGLNTGKMISHIIGVWALHAKAYSVCTYMHCT